MGHCLEATIQSVISQTYTDWDYIVIDGGSVDNSLDIISQYQNHFLYWCSEKDQGIADAFNKGLQHCKPESIVGFINAGDCLETDALENIAKIPFQAIIYGNSRYINTDKTSFIATANHIFLPYFMSLNHPSTFICKEIFDKYGFFDAQWKYAMDYDLILKFFVSGAHFSYINKTLSTMSLGGISDKNWKKAYYEAYLIRKKYFPDQTSYIDYLFQVLKRYIRNTLEKLGLTAISSFYKRYISKIKKYS